LFATACIVACSHGGGDREQHESSGVSLFLGKLQVPLFDSISVKVSGSDMADIHISKNSLEGSLKIEGIPQGEARKFEVKIYADSGTLVQKGIATADIIAGENITVPITLEALFGFLRLEIPLGFTNNTGVNSGKLFLENMEFDMKFENGKGIFNTNYQPLNKILELRIELKNANGEILFIGSKSLSLSSISQTETMQLQSIQGSAILELTASSEEPTQFLAMLPSISRPPENYGDVFFTEIFADPKTYGEPFEYIEIYNATIDFLELSGCRIATNRNAKTTAPTTRFDMPENLILPPMKFLFLGRDSVENADFNYEKFSLGNSTQSLGIFCGNFVIDSLYYSINVENKFPLKRGTAMQLPLKNYETREFGSSWCLGFSPGQDASCQ
jgi:hypothetical protein